MRSQKRRHESDYVFDDWASVHGRLLPWSEDQTTAHYESAQLRYLQRQPRSNEPSFWPLDETLELVEDEDDDDNPFARARGGGHWLWSTAAGSGLIAAVLFGRVLLYSGSGAHAAAPPIAPEPAPTQFAAPPPTAAIEPPSVDTDPALPAAGALQVPQSAVEVSHPTAHGERSQHHNVSHHHVSAEPAAHVSPIEQAPSVEHAPPPSAAPGTLRINSRPWSQVFVDDHLIGNTPQLEISLPAGSHTVRLANPEFGMSKVFSLRVRAGETVTRVETLEE